MCILLIGGLGSIFGYGPSLGNLEGILGKVPSATIPAQAAFAAALALIIVFTTGLLLDLFSPGLYRMIEAREFARHARHNATWLTPLFVQHSAYLSTNWKSIKTLSPPRNTAQVLLSSMLVTPFYGLFLAFRAFVSRSSRKRVSKMAKSRSLQDFFARRRAAKRRNRAISETHARILAFLFALVGDDRSEDTNQSLNQQISLHHASRAIAFAMDIFNLEIPVLVFLLAVLLDRNEWFKTALLHHLLEAIVVEWLLLGVPAALFGVISREVALRAYSRLCATLFAEAYLATIRLKTFRESAVNSRIGTYSMATGYSEEA